MDEGKGNKDRIDRAYTGEAARAEQAAGRPAGRADRTAGEPDHDSSGKENRKAYADAV